MNDKLTLHASGPWKFIYRYGGKSANIKGYYAIHVHFFQTECIPHGVGVTGSIIDVVSTVCTVAAVLY